MELKNCEYCGTAYDARLSQCPLCGRTAGGQKSSPRAGGKRLRTADADQQTDSPAQGRRTRGAYAGKRVRDDAAARAAARQDNQQDPAGQPKPSPYAIPKWMMVTICVILGVAVLGGALLAFSRLGWSPLYRETTLQQTEPQQTQTEQTAEPQPAQAETQAPAENRYTNEEDQKPAEQETEQPVQEDVACTSLTLSAPTVTFEDAGRFFNITFTRKPDNCTEDVVFTSSDESVATVSEQGKIVAINAGSAVITANCGSQSATCLVTCDFAYVGQEEETTEAEVSLAISKEDLTFFSAGEQYQLTVSGAPEGAVIVYSINDESVATVNPNGLLTAKGGGTATVTVTVDEYPPLSCIVRCNFSSSQTDGGTYTISNSDVTMGVKGETFQISLRDENGNKVTGLLWVSSDLSVCSVDGTGVVKAEGQGTAYISTTYNGASYQCIVRCNLH